MLSADAMTGWPPQAPAMRTRGHAGRNLPCRTFGHSLEGEVSSRWQLQEATVWMVRIARGWKGREGGRMAGDGTDKVTISWTHRPRR